MANTPSTLENIISQIRRRPEEQSFRPQIFTEFLRPFQNFVDEFDLAAVGQTCRERATDSAKPYLLVSADLSGIQDTVYTISSKGALKSLRARSFLLEFLCEHICYELVTAVLHDYRKHRNHIVFSGGGNVALFLPNSDDTTKMLSKFREALNKWALEEFSGKLYVSIQEIGVSEQELTDDALFRQTWERLSALLEKNKRTKFDWDLKRFFGDDAVENGEPKQRTGTEECQICHRDNIELSAQDPFYPITSRYKPITTIEELTKKAETADVVHDLCYHLFRLGDRLTTIERIYRFAKTPAEHGYLKFPTISDGFAYYSTEPGKSPDCEWLVNETHDDAITFLFGNHVRKVGDLPAHVKEAASEEDTEDEHTASLHALARAARGSELVGCLRMDVDNLGRLFFEDLQQFNIETLSRLSRLLNLFFKVFLTRICACDLEGIPGAGKVELVNVTNKTYEAGKGRNVAIIYSGGDDLFIAGAWDEVAELSFDIQRYFARYSGLGISAAVTLHKSDFPFHQMAKMSEEALDTAKAYVLAGENEPRKNRFALFYAPQDRHKSETLNSKAAEDAAAGKSVHENKLMYALDWHHPITHELLSILVSLSEVVEDKIRLQGLSRGFMYKLFNLLEVWWSRGTMYVPEFVYLVERIRKKMDAEDFDRLSNIIFNFPVKDNPQNHRTIKMLKTPLTWFELLQRSKGDRDGK